MHYRVTVTNGSNTLSNQEVDESIVIAESEREAAEFAAQCWFATRRREPLSVTVAPYTDGEGEH